MRTLVAVAVIVMMSGCTSTANKLSIEEKAQVVVHADTETLCRLALTKPSYKALAEAELGLRNATCDWRQLKLASRFVHYGSGMSEHRAQAASVSAQQMGAGGMPQGNMQPVIPAVCKTTYHGSQKDNDCDGEFGSVR